MAETMSGTLWTDTITDWMTASFVAKSTGPASELLGINNNTEFDSIALQLTREEESLRRIDGQELNVFELSYDGVSLWERQGTGTAPMDPNIVELMERANFLEGRKLKEDLENTINNLLFDLGILDGDGDKSIQIEYVRAYITPPGSANNNNDNPGDVSAINPSAGNENLEIIIIVAIVVACLAFCLLIFAVAWAWRSDRNDRVEKPPRSDNNNKKRSSNYEAVTNGSIASKEVKVEKLKTFKKKKEPAPAPVIKPNGSYPSVIGDTSGAVSVLDTDDDDTAGNNTNGSGNLNNPFSYPDSVVSSDISTSLTAYYKSGMYNGSKRGGAPKDFNDAASMSSMDSYGYSLDGYAPSLGPAQGGYPVGPLQSARDAPIPLGDSQDEMNANDETMQQLQDEESIVDYDAEA